MYMTEGDFVHIEHTGSNTNPNNNDGQGRQGTDRSNYVVQQTLPVGYTTEQYSNFEKVMTFEDGGIDIGSAGASHPSYVKQPDGYFIPEALQKDVQDAESGTMGGMSELQLA